jgi:allantoinase
MTELENWPNGKRVAFILSVLLETWSEGKPPPFSIQATAVKAGVTDHSGIAWGEYGGKVGVWRLLRAFRSFGIKATFCPNARSAELYPDAIKAIAKDGHGLGAHAIYQDQLLAYLSEDEQRSAIRGSIETIERICGVRPDGWASPVLSWTPHTIGMLVGEGLAWTQDPTFIEVPQILRSGDIEIVGIPASDFTDHRVMKSNPRDFFDVYKGTFDYLRDHEPMPLLHMSVHCHWGGRPLMMAVLYDVLRYLKDSGDVWFTTHTEISRLVRARGTPMPSFSAHHLGA